MKVLSFSQLNEKLGVSDEVTSTAKFIMALISNNFMEEVDNNKPFNFEFPEKYWDKFMRDKIISLDVVFDTKFAKEFNAQMSVSIVNHQYVKATLYLASRPKLSNVAHEIQHMYEYSRRLKRKFQSGEMTSEFETTKRRKWFYYFSEGVMGHSSNISAFSNAVYYSLDEEMNARVQEVFHAVKDEATSKEHFIELVKANYNYGIAKDLQSSAMGKLIKDIDEDWAFDFVNKLYYVFNRQHLYVRDEKKSILQYFYDGLEDSIRLGFEAYIKHIGHRFTNELSREQAKGFIRRWDKHFKKQGKKFERKLFKTWDMVDIESNYKQQHGEDSVEVQMRNLKEMRKKNKLKLARLNRETKRDKGKVISYDDYQELIDSSSA